MRQSWITNIVEKPWLVLALGFVFIIASSIGAENLYFRGDYKIFFEEDNPQRVAFEDMQAMFNKNETANIIVAPESGNVFNEDTLRLIKQITDEAWQTPYSIRVDSIANYQHTWAEEDDLIVEDLILEDEPLDQQTMQRVEEVSLSEPNTVGRLVSADGAVAMIAVTVNMPDENKTLVVEEVTKHVMALSEKYQQTYPEHEFYHTGMVVMYYAFDLAAREDASTLVPLMFLTIIVVLWLLLRSFSGVVATVVIIITAISTTMGLAGWMGYFLSTATVNVPTVVMTLAVADCVHVIASMLFGLRQGLSKKEAIIYSLKLNIMPIFITSATTSIGFLTLNFSNVPVLADLGNLTAIGVMLAFVFSVTILPVLLNLLPMRTQNLAENSSDRMERFGDWVIDNHRKILPFTFILVIAAAAGASLNKINDVATEYFDHSTEFRRSADFQEQNLSGMSNIDFAIFTGTESGLNNPEVLRKVDDFSEWLRQQPEVDHVSSIADTFRRLNKNMHGDDETYYRLPREQELAAQYLLLYEMSLPYGLDLNNQINIEKSATRLMVTLKNQGSKEFTEFEQRARDWFEQNAPDLTLTAGSPNLMFAHIGEANMASLMQGSVLALVLISGLIVFALRSLRMGFISLLPNLLPALIGFGIWGVYSGEINMGLSVVLSMTLGIIVDDTVHFLSKYKHARDNGSNAEEAVRYAFTSVGRALWITTMVLTLGFLVLSLSNFALNADMGLLTAIIILSALAVDFLFLPAFLLVFDNKPSDVSKKEENLHAESQPVSTS